MAHYIGADPGVGGGIAALDAGGDVVVAVKMPETDRDLLDVLASCRCVEGAAYAVLEKVHSSPQMGVASAFTFGKGYGALRMALVASHIVLDEVTPQKWQRVMGCLTRGDKNVSKARAQDLFPRQKVTHAVADALLLAEYCRRGRLGRDGLNVSAITYLLKETR